jgi:hypothetical protein
MSNKPMARIIQPYELGADEIEYFYKAVDTDPHSGGVDIVSKLIMDDIMQLWLYHREDTVLIAITRIMTNPDGYRELLIAMMAGSNVTSTNAHQAIDAAMMRYAVRKGCARMIAMVKPEIWANFGELTGYHEEYMQISLYPEDILSRGEPDA